MKSEGGTGRRSSQCELKTAASIVVIKVGTSSLLKPETNSLYLSLIAKLCETVAKLCNKGYKVVIVTSGAVGVGALQLGLKKKPTDLAKKQALAAVGQQHLMRHYNDFFTALGHRCAQVLLTLDNLANRSQYLNARNTFEALFEYGVIPIVNENDTVAVQELRVGDNDTLSAQVATLVGADYLFLLTDVDGLYTSNPNTDPTAERIPIVEDITKLTAKIGNAGSEFGTGGMQTKLTAARIATSAGCKLVIMLSEGLERIPGCLDGDSVGTLFMPVPNHMKGRKRWILTMPIRGELVLDAGAVKAVKAHRSLFPAGVKEVRGVFNAMEAIRICNTEMVQVAVGIINYNSTEVQTMLGRGSAEYQGELGYNGPDEVIHRDNLCVMIDTTNDPTSPSSQKDTNKLKLTPTVSHATLEELAKQCQTDTTLDGSNDS
mmetsp:Transcript_19842/g.23811  ORF Transcript_19842/g.23811 Transcript_19842/m.23811 type:complete len:432 (+) Transcript_19842:197-1492(+)|eukprot:CAMPEP_0197849702 /NCGR_PEP_ID=MMETSP1438-20131217/12928_1 /TAXON_ID=1461541 /ORGANISM="Pterosperma sp., Strain CCMP1384" /LENGTH=431 /DNA_ID=CAMNT_0043462495 /DNA_START=197 /DNA_END=1492 /DNA_ORIENTATION=+